jgi:hypothetical protein
VDKRFFAGTFFAQVEIGEMVLNDAGNVAKQLYATGGYLVVKEDGEVLCYYVYKRNEFESYPSKLSF